MQVDLNGKTALITGGNTGIGRDIAITLAKSGARVALTYYSNDKSDTVGEIQDAGGRATAYYLDTTDSAQVNQVVSKVVDEYAHIDILVNNAGGLIDRVKIVDMRDTHWHKVINVNLSSAFYCSRAVLPYMQRGWGRIINISSVAAYNGGGTGAIPYGTAKAGMIGFTRGLAREIGSQKITVNTVAPGMILDTPFHETFTSEDRIQAMIANTPLGRVGHPPDVSGAVLFLVSELAAFITGEVIIVNGGAYFA